MAEFVAPVPVRRRLGKALQPRFSFPFLPSNGIATNNKEVRRVPDAQLPNVLDLVCWFDRRWLIPELQRLRVVLVLVEGGEFDSMAFGLDRDPHLSARVARAYVPRCAADPARGR